MIKDFDFKISQYFKKFRKMFKMSKNIGMDLGTANTLVCVDGEGIQLNEPSCIAFVYEKGVMVPYAFGKQAKNMQGKTPEDIHTIRPLKDGVIADFRAAEEMIKHFIKSVNKNSFMSRPLVIVCVPSGSTPVERRAIQDAVESAGAKEVYLIFEPMAAAIGAGLPVTEPTGCMVIDIGGGTTEVAVISLGGVVISKSIRVGGDSFDEAIVSYIRKFHNLLIGEVTAERIKKTIGAACILSDSTRSLEIKGRDLIQGVPKEITITEHQVVESLQELLNMILQVVLDLLEKAPPELSCDIIERGIVMTGGGSLLRNISNIIFDGTGVKVIVADDPLSCVALGIEKVLANLKELGHVLFKQE